MSLYVERGGATFRSVHVEAARRIASRARQGGVERFVHISGIGADAASASPYIKSRGEGELAVRAEFPDAIILRPSVMFGPGDTFLTQILKLLLHRLPAYPLFGSGLTRLQPAYVEDVAEAVATVLERADTGGVTVECAGPHVYSYRELLSDCRCSGRHPFLAGSFCALACIDTHRGEITARPARTTSGGSHGERQCGKHTQRGFKDFNISPRSIEQILPSMLPTALALTNDGAGQQRWRLPFRL